MAGGKENWKEIGRGVQMETADGRREESRLRVSEVAGELGHGCRWRRVGGGEVVDVGGSE